MYKILFTIERIHIPFKILRKSENLGLQCNHVNILYFSVYQHVQDWLYYSDIDENTKVWDDVLRRMVDTLTFGWACCLNVVSRSTRTLLILWILLSFTILECCILNVEAARSSETSANVYQMTQRKVKEDWCPTWRKVRNSTWEMTV